MQTEEKISRRSFLTKTLTGMTLLSLAPFVDLWAQQRQDVARWAKEASLYKFHMIGHAHIDPVWLWSWREGLSVVMSTFRAALDRMEENPEFKFTASSVLFYKWVAENDSELFKKIRKRIEEGRWEVVGGWWIEPDAILPCGESFVRQGLYGQLLLDELIGSRAKTGFLPDSFGHINSLPQILLGHGLKRYVFTRPYPHELTLPAEIFWWKGPDGSKVLGYRIQVAYSNSKDIRVHLERIIKEYGDKQTRTYMDFYGAGDHGGGATKKNFQQIAEIRREPGAPKLVYSTPERYFKEIGQDGTMQIPTVEMFLGAALTGCYTSGSELKKNNRQAEAALITAEKIAAVGAWAWDGIYPAQELRQAWEKVMFLQFHDSLAGTSQSDHFDVARQGYGYALETADQVSALSLQKLEWQIASEDPESEYLIVFNPHAWETNGEITYDLNIKGEAAPFDEQGNPLPYQWTLGSSYTESVRKLIFQTVLPPMGYRQIRVRKQEAPLSQSLELKVSERGMENRFLKVTFSHTGAIGIFDKESGREVFSGGATGCKAVVIKDEADAWGFGVRKYDEVIGQFGNASFKVLERGPLRGCIRVTTGYGASSLCVDWMLTADSRAVNAVVNMDWYEREKMLKFTFPVQVENGNAMVETPYACMSISHDGNEMPGHRWIDLSGRSQGETYGVAVLNDAKFGYSVCGEEMSLTIVRSPVYAMLTPRRPESENEYQWMDQGRQSMRLKIVPHAGDWRTAGIPRLAEEFSAVPRVTYQGIHGGRLPKKASFLSVDVPNVQVSVVKHSEKENNLVIRCVETWGRPASVRLNIPFLDTRWTGEFAPFEIKTLLIGPRNGKVVEVNLLEE